MNDERIINELSRIRMKMHLLWLILPILSFGGQVFSEPNWTLWHLLPEIVLFTATTISLVVSMLRRKEASIVDERTIETSYAVVRTSFYWIIGSVVATHYLRMVVGSQAAQFSGVTVSIFLSITFYAYYFFSIRKGIYFNYEAMESNNAAYWRNVLRRIGVMILFFAGLFLMYWLISLIWQVRVNPRVIGISMSGSMILLIGQYAVLSFLERIHFRETREVEVGRVRLFHNIAVVVMLYAAAFSLVHMAMIYTSQYLLLTDQQTPEMAVTFQFASILFLLGMFDLFFFYILQWIFLKKHLLLAYPILTHWLSIGVFVLIFLSAVSLGISTFLQFPLFSFIVGESMVRLIQALGMASQVVALLIGLIQVALNVFLWKKGHRFAILQPIWFLLLFFYPLAIGTMTLQRPGLVYGVQMTLLLVATVMRIVYVVSGGRTFVLSPPEAADLEQTKADAV